jgi:uncharacterized protein involved in response to NO
MVLLTLGMRPFYLLAGAFAALAIPVRALQYTGWVPRTDAFWHAHEMLFGFAFAVIAGFLLTAVRNWTGRETASGPGLATLAAIWLVGRGMAFVSLPVAVAFDVIFALGLAIAIGRPLVASGNKRNLFFIVLMLAMGGASVAFYLEPRLGLAIGLDIVLFVMAVIGGRVIPMFTNNAVPGAGARQLPWLEKAAVLSVLAILVADVFSMNVAIFAAIAALLHATRLALWRPQRTLHKPILWVLHASYAWIVVHLVLRALGAMELVPPSLATHALTVGAIGGLTLGMMTRTARGHTGRPLQAGTAEVTAYVLVHAAAIVRVLFPLALPAGYLWWIGIAAALWSAAFAIFVVAYFPILARKALQ